MRFGAVVMVLLFAAFGAVFGALGAFLALPVAATIQAVMSTYLQRHELIDETLLDESQPPATAAETTTPTTDASVQDS